MLLKNLEKCSQSCNYLYSNYNNSIKLHSIGLISETPTNFTYWLYSDNFLASLVLQSPCNDFDLAQNISKTISQYPRYSNQYLELNSFVWNFNSSKNYRVNDSIWTTINNQSGTLSPNDYADTAFLQAYYYGRWTTDGVKALSLFDIGYQMYKNNTGFVDKAFTGQFQTYKLALYIFVASVLHQPIQLSAIVNLLRMQDESSGGFYTSYLPNFSNDNSSTNTETTCLALLAITSVFP